MSSRMTDEEWMKQIDNGRLPKRSEWIEPVLGDRQQPAERLAPSRGGRGWAGERIIGE